MGIDPANDDYVAGNNCAICKDVSFGGLTPRYIEVQLKDIETCPAKPSALDGVFLLTQSGLPCRWTWTDGTWSIFLNFTAVDSSLDVIRIIDRYFQSPAGTPCQTEFTNIIVACGPLIGGKNGTAKIFWGPTIGP